MWLLGILSNFVFKYNYFSIILISFQQLSPFTKFTLITYEEFVKKIILLKIFLNVISFMWLLQRLGINNKCGSPQDYSQFQQFTRGVKRLTRSSYTYSFGLLPWNTLKSDNGRGAWRSIQDMSTCKISSRSSIVESWIALISPSNDVWQHTSRYCQPGLIIWVLCPEILLRLGHRDIVDNLHG